MARTELLKETQVKTAVIAVLINMVLAMSVRWNAFTDGTITFINPFTSIFTNFKDVAMSFAIVLVIAFIIGKIFAGVSKKKWNLFQMFMMGLLISVIYNGYLGYTGAIDLSSNIQFMLYSAFEMGLVTMIIGYWSAKK